MESTDPKSLLKRKILQAFKRFDVDNSGWLDINEFQEIMQVVNVNVGDMELVEIFNYIDRDRDGRLELDELEHFLGNPFEPHEVVRVTMDLNLKHPLRFLKYHTWNVKSRPLELLLQTGSNSFGAYFLASSDPQAKYLQEGSKLMYINAARVDEERYVDIINVLKSIAVPFELTFQGRDTLRYMKCADRSGRFKPMNPTKWDDKLSSQEIDMIARPYRLHEQEEKVYQIIEAPIIPPHCRHCPPHNVWYRHVHRFMDDESYSLGSMYLAWFIMFLICLSTCTYILETLPSWEDWELWWRVEEVVAIIFSVEFAIRLASCRNVATYLTDSWNIVDICAIAPLWIELLTAGILDARVLRTVRALRLLRLVRLARKNAIGEIMEIYTQTFRSSLEMVFTMFVLALLTIIVIATFATLFEMGHRQILGDCNQLNPNQTCDESNVIQTYDNVPIRDLCWGLCEGLALGGCCSFDQVTGSCSMFNTSVLSTSGASENAGLCGIYEQSRRKDEEQQSPFLTIPESIWWATVSLTIVGYGEFSPTSIPGRLLAVVAVSIGLFFFALPLSVIGWNFSSALHSANYRKAASRYEAWIMSIEKKSVKHLLQEVNWVMSMPLFAAEDEYIFLESHVRLDTKLKVEEVLRYDNGWSFLPFADHHEPDFPRITQFNLFVLFAIFGRNYQKKLTALAIQKKKVNLHLDSYGEPTFQSRSSLGAGQKRRAGHSISLRRVNFLSKLQSPSVVENELRFNSGLNDSAKSDVENSDHSAVPLRDDRKQSHIELVSVPTDSSVELSYADV